MRAYPHTAAAQPQPSGVMNSPYTAINVAMAWVPRTAIHRMRAGRIDQNGPRVRVKKMVRCPATDSMRYIRVCSCGWPRSKTRSPRKNRPNVGDRTDDTEHGGDTEHEAHVPGFGLILVVDVVVGDRQDGAVVQQREHHDHDRGDGKEVEDQDRERHEQQHPQRLGDAVDRVAVHSLEDLAALFDRVDDHRQAGRRQHDVGGGACGVGGARDRDAAVGFFQRGRVVDPVAGHADDVAALL